MSDSVAEIGSFTSVGSLGEVTSASMLINAQHGWHITRGRPAYEPTTQGGTTYDETGLGYPLEAYTLMRLSFGHGTDVYERYLEVRTLKPQATSLGLFEHVELSGLERNLKDILVPGHWWFRTYRDVLDDIVAHYNAQRGTVQPALRLLDANIGVDLNRTTLGPINFYAGTDCFSAINQLVDRLRQPLQSGGLGDYVSAYYTDRVVPPPGARNWTATRRWSAGDIAIHNGRAWRIASAGIVSDPPDRSARWEEVTGLYLGIDLHIVSQGARGDAIPIIRSAEIEGTSTVVRHRYAPQATLTIVRGMAGTGTMPMSVAHYAGRTEAFARATPWRAGVRYGEGQLVRHRPTSGNNADGTPQNHPERRWRCRVAHLSSATNAPPASGAQNTQWAAVTEWEYVNASGRVARDNWAYIARQSGGMWDADADDDAQSYDAGYSSVTFPDSNLVIRDVDTWGDWAHYRLAGSSSARIASDAAEGTRVLIDGIAPSLQSDGTPSGLSTPTDDNALVQRYGGTWIVMRRFEQDPGDTTYEVNVLREGKVYEWSPGPPTVARADEFWNAQDDYVTGYVVRYTAVAADVTAVPTLVSGTTYVYRRLSFATSRYVRPSTLMPPPRDTRRWELVGQLDDDNAPVGHVPRGYGPERRSRAGPRAWRDASEGGIVPNHCFHYPYSVSLVEPLVRKPDGAPASLPRAVRVEYLAASPVGAVGLMLTPEESAEVALAHVRFAAAHVGTAISSVLAANGLPPLGDDADISPQGVFKSLSANAQRYFARIRGYTNLGWWYTLFEAPLPMAGGGPFVPPFLDLNNRNMTPSGASGWTAMDAEELDKLTGIRFDIWFDKLFGLWRVPQGNLPFRCFILDNESNIWIHDFAVRHLGVRQDVLLNFSSFKSYSARTPINLSNAILNAIRPELRELESLNRRQIKHIGLHLLSPYDEHGRFVPWFNPWNNLFETFGKLATGAVRHIGIIDNFAFVKAPIAIERRGPADNEGAVSRNIMAPVAELPISNTVQLRQAAQARAHLNAWRLDNMTVKIPGRHDILAEQSVVLADPRLVSESDVGGAAGAGTLKLAVTRVSHSYQADGGGWLTDLTLYRRINRGTVA